MDYLVRIIGHILEERRPPEFPKEVVNALVIRAETPQALNDAVNTQANIFLRIGGMMVLKNPGDMQEMNDKGELVGFDRRMFVPMTMISHMDTLTKVMSAEVPGIDEEEDEEVLFQ